MFMDNKSQYKTLILHLRRLIKICFYINKINLEFLEKQKQKVINILYPFILCYFIKELLEFINRD